MSENVDGCTSLEERNFEHEPNRTLPWGHHYASLFVSPRCGRGGLDLALMELSDILTSLMMRFLLRAVQDLRPPPDIWPQARGSNKDKARAKYDLQSCIMGR